MNALRVATIHGAEGIGMGNDLGSIESGKMADLVILGANPLASNALLKLNAGLGLEYFLTDFLGLEISLDNNYLMSDGLDGVNNGKYNDFFYRTRLGLKYYLSRNKKK